MSTALDLITGSMRLLGVLAQGEVPAASEATNALSALNDMIDSWSTEQLMIYAKVNETFPLVAGQQSYTMGTGGNFNTARAQKIENAILTVTSGAQPFDLPIEILNQDQWAYITVKSTTSDIPTKLYSQGTFPLDTLWFWPVPDLANSVTLWSWKALSEFPALTTILSLPPGYAKPLRYNLAIELAPEYGLTPSETIVDQATLSKAALKSMNNRTLLLATDAALMNKTSVFNWLTGE